MSFKPLLVPLKTNLISFKPFGILKKWISYYTKLILIYSVSNNWFNFSKKSDSRCLSEGRVPLLTFHSVYLRFFSKKKIGNPLQAFLLKLYHFQKINIDPLTHSNYKAFDNLIITSLSASIYLTTLPSRLWE